jgi:hypothetical protein
MSRRGWCLTIGLALFALQPGTTLVAQPRGCLHGPTESDSQRAKRQQALRWIELINRQERSVRQSLGEYIRDISVSGVDAVPAGFVSQIVAASTAYAVSVKDTTDPCRFSYFSDQEGDVYGGQIVR